MAKNERLTEKRTQEVPRRGKRCASRDKEVAAKDGKP